MRPSAPSRSQTIEKIRSKLSMPRVQLSLMLAITALFAFVLSVVLLRLGVTSMMVRYPIAVVSSYVVFLLLLRVWIWLQCDEPVGSVDIPVDLALSNIDLPAGA